MLSFCDSASRRDEGFLFHQHRRPFFRAPFFQVSPSFSFRIHLIKFKKMSDYGGEDDFGNEVGGGGGG